MWLHQGLFNCMAGDEIYANQSSIVGSIGVIYSSFGFKDLIENWSSKTCLYC